MGRRRRILAVLAVAAALLGAASKAPSEYTAPEAPHAYALRGPASAARARAGEISWWGGRYRTSTGADVSVLVSASYPQDEAVARRWAEYFASLVHGDELASVTVRVATPAEVEELCGEGTAGCYGADRLVTVGEDVPGMSAAGVAAHEYGHHVAAHRANPPWKALDWGPKRWAAAMTICERAAAGTVFPGDRGAQYRLNPGEAWAESYRLLNERRADPAASSWPIVSAALFPTAAALAAAEQDVLRPWAQPKARLVRGRFVGGRRRVWSLRVATPLDGAARVDLGLPAATPYRLTLLGLDGRVLARGRWESATRQVATATVCGHRSVVARVERLGPPARFTLRVWSP